MAAEARKQCKAMMKGPLPTDTRRCVREAGPDGYCLQHSPQRWLKTIEERIARLKSQLAALESERAKMLRAIKRK